MSRRTVFVTWRTPSRQMDIRFFLKIWTTRSRRRRDSYVSKLFKTKWDEIQPSSISWKPPDEIYKFHSLQCSSPLPWSSYLKFLLFFFENPLFSFPSENSTFGPKLFINISSKNRAVSQVNSTICHFGWRTTIRQHLSWALLYPPVSTLVLAHVIIALGTYVATNCIRHLTNSFSSSGHLFFLFSKF